MSAWQRDTASTLRGCLGSVLRSKFDFSSFDGIAAAYERAFGPSQRLQDLAGSLKRIEQVRHLIVHRGGITDERFLKLPILRHVRTQLSALQWSKYETIW